VIVELDLPPGLDAETVLDVLFEAIRGQPGSRYYNMTERRNRCVTVYYADGMHLDLTPAELVPQREPKTSWIFHHKPETPAVPGYRLLANPYGFAEWFTTMTPLDYVFAEAFAKRGPSRPCWNPRIRFTKAVRLFSISITGEPCRNASAFRWAMMRRGFAPHGKPTSACSHVAGSGKRPA
jgi:hypothetical protein